MKQSQLFGKTQKEIPADITSKSHQFLHRAGYTRESVPGRHYFLPLGMRVQDKIMHIIEEEMDRVGAQKMLTPTLHPLELWEETNRTKSTSFELMIVKDRRDMQFALGGTAEEMMVDVVRRFNISYKDLPFNIYQFSNKFRDEIRTRGGLLRTREFIMKDAYSFHADADDFRVYYELMRRTYDAIFSRLEIPTRFVEADNGYIGGEYSHEFQVEHPEGEGKFFVSEKGEYCAHEDVARCVYDMVNENEEIKAMEIVAQPEWVKTMEDNVKHYGKGAESFLKNVVYRTTEGDLVVVTIRGDLDVNKTKLESLLSMVGQLDDATTDDLTALGTKTGYVHAWGHDFITPRRAQTEDRDCKVIYVADESLKTVRNFIGGQKEETTDSIHVNYGRDFTHEVEGDVALVREGFRAPDGSNSVLVEKRGIEVGNIFQLGHHYSSLMNATYVDAEGKSQYFYMGCYGIGIGRTLATIVEMHHDDKGIIWPEEIAPFQVHLLSLDKGNQEVRSQADLMYTQLLDRGVEVLYDDRDLAPGEKFADADLIGIPWRVVMSERSLASGGVEVKRRDSETAEIVSIDDLFDRFH